MNRLELKLKQLARRGEKALSVFLTAGYPAPGATERIVPALAEAGVDFFEIGFPFSDPIADGPVIQKSSERALRRGMTWGKLLSTARAIRKKTEVPLVLMTYSNPVFARGWRRAAREVRAAGFDGVILPDLIAEQSAAARTEFRKAGLCLIFLVAPTSGPERIRRLARASSGFLYAVSVTGVTGARRRLPRAEVLRFLRSVRRGSRLPVLLGFGISDPAQLRDFAPAADGFIVGSALVRVLEKPGSPASLIRRAKNFMMSFARQKRGLPSL